MGLFERGNGMIVVARQAGGTRLRFAAFLVDTFCLGVKDVIFEDVDVSEFDAMIEVIEQGAPFAEAEPAYARKLVREAVTYARSLGFEPHAAHAAAEVIFGDYSAESCDASFSFGCDGRPHYIPGPTETRAQIRRRMEHLRARLGDDGFDFTDPEDLDFGDDEYAEGYDPAEAPDPVEWLALDEGDRLALIVDYHERAAPDLTDEQIYGHAALHAVIENQAALGDELPVRGTIARLMKEGLDRHEAVHAVAAVLVDHLPDFADPERATAELQNAYKAAVDQLTVERWRREYGDPDGS
jgi:hypothetical protein